MAQHWRNVGCWHLTRCFHQVVVIWPQYLAFQLCSGAGAALNPVIFFVCAFFVGVVKILDLTQNEWTRYNPIFLREVYWCQNGRQPKLILQKWSANWFVNILWTIMVHMVRSRKLLLGLKNNMCQLLCFISIISICFKYLLYLGRSARPFEEVILTMHRWSQT